MTTVSLLTPLDPRRDEWLADLGTDVDALRTRSSAPIEWIVCVDGPRAAQLPDNISSSVCLPLPGGPAAARTGALAESTGEWVLPIDADDRLDVAGTAKFSLERFAALVAILLLATSPTIFSLYKLATSSTRALTRGVRSLSPSGCASTTHDDGSSYSATMISPTSAGPHRRSASGASSRAKPSARFVVGGTTDSAPLPQRSRPALATSSSPTPACPSDVGGTSVNPKPPPQPLLR